MERSAGDNRTHTLVGDAPASEKPWTRIVSLESLRYQGSGWWLDAALPRSPVGLLAASVVLPLAWFGIGLAITPDRSGYIDTPDVKYQIPFLALHVLCLRVMGSLWARGLDPALEGLGIDRDGRSWVRRGVLGKWANLGALLSAAYFIGRDTYKTLVPDAVSGLTAFDDPEMWDFASLGHGVRDLMLGVWHYEWLIYGYLTWLQLWCLVALTRALRQTDFSKHIARLLIHDDYRDFFALLGQTATISMVFALGNLGFIHLTGELFPHEAVEITGVGSFVTEMSDLLSTALLFVVLLLGFVIYLKLLRGALTRTVNGMFAAAGDAGLAALAEPLELSGDATTDFERLRARVDAQAALVRAMSFQREVDSIGSRSLSSILLKSSPALMTTLRRLVKLKIGVP